VSIFPVTRAELDRTKGVKKKKMENLNCRGIFFRVERIEGEHDLSKRLRRRMSLP